MTVPPVVPFKLEGEVRNEIDRLLTQTERDDKRIDEPEALLHQLLRDAKGLPVDAFLPRLLNSQDEIQHLDLSAQTLFDANQLFHLTRQLHSLHCVICTLSETEACAVLKGLLNGRSQLKVLHMGPCHASSLVACCHTQTQLEELHLEHCHALTGEHLEGLACCLHGLRLLSLEDLPNASAEGIAHLLKANGELEGLIIDSMTNFTPSEWEAIADSTRALKVLVLKEGALAPASAVLRFAQRNPALEVLYVGAECGIDNRSAEHLARHLPSLHTLSVRLGKPYLTGSGLQKIVYGAERLRHLSVSVSRPSEGVFGKQRRCRVLQASSRLQSLHLYNVQDFEIGELSTWVYCQPRLQHMSLLACGSWWNLDEQGRHSGRAGAVPNLGGHGVCYLPQYNGPYFEEVLLDALSGCLGRCRTLERLLPS